MAFKAFDRRLGQARVRCSVNGLFEQLARALIVAAAAAALTVLSRRLLAVDLLPSQVAWLGLAALGLVSLILWLRRVPGRMETALLVDDRLALRERFSSALALAGSDDPFAVAARQETYRAAQGLAVARAFPIRPSRWWVYAAAVWLAVGLLGLVVPQKDLLGRRWKRQQEQQQAGRIEKAKEDVTKAAAVVKLAMERLTIPDANQDLAGLASILAQARPEDIRRQAIRQLGSLEDKVKAMQSSLQGRSMEQLRQMLGQLRPSGQGLIQQIEVAMAKGEFGKAASLLRQIQQDMQDGRPSDQQRQDLARQVQDLGRQLQRLGQQQKGLGQQLQEMGLDKDLAGLDGEKLREALQQQGLGSDKLEDLVQKAAAARQAAGRAAALGGALAGGAGGLSAADLALAAQQLDDMEGLQGQIRAGEATLAQIEGAIGHLGEGMGQQRGGQASRDQGLADGMQQAFGGPGTATGPHTRQGGEGLADKATERSLVKGIDQQDAIVASWYFKGTQVTGQSRRSLQEILAAARDSAAEAIQDNEIPAKYQDAVKKYFGNLENTGDVGH